MRMLKVRVFDYSKSKWCSTPFLFKGRDMAPTEAKDDMGHSDASPSCVPSSRGEQLEMNETDSFDSIWIF